MLNQGKEKPFNFSIILSDKLIFLSHKLSFKSKFGISGEISFELKTAFIISEYLE